MKKIKFIILLFTISILQSCSKSDPTSFTAPPAIVFDYLQSVGNKQSFSFLGSSSTVAELRVPVIINGFPEDRDRFFEVDVVTDTITDAKSTDYSIARGIIRAGRVKDILIVSVNKTEELDDKVLNLYLRVKANDEFDRGIIERQYYQLAWSNQTIMPTWGVYFRTFFSAVGSTKAYRIFVETTGLKNFTITEFRTYQQVGAEVLGKEFGDYIRAWNLANPNDILVHDDGTQKGQPIVPRY